MKNFTAIGAALLAVGAFGTAQASGLESKSVMLGLSMSKYSGSDAEPSGTTQSYRMGMAIGGAAVMDFGAPVKLRTGAMYIQKGATSDAGAVGKYEFKVDYIEIPVLAQYDLDAGSMKAHLFGGLSLGFVMKSEVTASGTFGGLGDGTTNMKSDTNSMDYGIQLGAALNVTKEIYADVRYTMGLAKVDKTDPIQDTKNSTILIGAGYSF